MKEEISNEQYRKAGHEMSGESVVPPASDNHAEEPLRELWEAATDDDTDGRYTDIDAEVLGILDGTETDLPQKQLGTALDGFSERLNNRFDVMDRRKKGILLLVLAAVIFIIGMVYLYNLARQFI